ncbi:MAG: hypothetical protein A3G20_04555 [Acidobacteria bacterium RIFCSPLOWO2_12_FULL_59_11]|nr:MAG: hypothetical protein A3G20_04555 [Acidobacteria bacterium RIFCSPLOWO2_12_FULL_59_11]
MHTSLTDKKYWTNSYGNTPFVKYELENDHFKLLFTYAGKDKINSVIEIGSFPGPFLAALGECGFELNGIDFHPKNEIELPDWLRSLGYTVGLFYSEDFLVFPFEKNFDLVYSLGFIEHFEDFDKIIRRHASLVKDDKYLFISAPNFKGAIQKWLHYFLDKENLDKHYLPSMDPEVWAEVLRKEGFKVLFSGYYGQIGFWVDRNNKRSLLKSILATAIARLFWNIRKIYKVDSKHFSVFCGIVAVKEGTN